MQLPFEPYENDAVEFGDQLQNTLMKLNENIHGYSVGITLYSEEMGTNHMFIKRLRDELSYQYQVTASPRFIIAQGCTYLLPMVEIQHYCNSNALHIWFLPCKGVTGIPLENVVKNRVPFEDWKWTL